MTTDVFYAIGDIHGQHTMLQALLAKLTSRSTDERDTFIFLGDYVDRGENSRAVIDSLLEWRNEHPNTIFLRGNHEQLMLDVRDAPPGISPCEQGTLALAWLRNGGSEALVSYAASGYLEWVRKIGNHFSRLAEDEVEYLGRCIGPWIDVIPDTHWDFLRATTMEFLTPRYHFVHAGLLAPGQTWSGEGWSIDPRLWIREPFVSSRADFDGRIVVFGHTPQRSGRPLVHLNKVGLDTGAVFGGPLTAGVFHAADGDERAELTEIIQVAYMRATFEPDGSESAQICAARRRASSARSSK